MTVSQIKLLFECLGGSNAIVKGKLYFDDPVIEWEVTTDAIWVGDDQGKDLTINFASKEINNKGVFYTDANGLEMQQRVLSFQQG